ncbi:MAG: methionine--tRNA ligase [Chloroflexi bacterium]|nr:methionine--tRNA ligase [Chloroflexota bacterium]
MAERILVCLAWPYVNGSLHVGHLAGVYIPGDIFARFHRLLGNDVLMVSGSDEHGTPITVRAEQEGVSPKEIADRYHEEFLGYWRALGISWDLYTRTGTENHRAVVQEEFLDLLHNGYLFEQTLEAFYDPRAGRFLPDRYVEGTCPNCGYERARGDQCDQCGRLLDPIQLIEPRSRLSGEQPVLRATTHFFLDLPRLQQGLIEWVRPRTYWRPNVYSFTLNFLEGGLQPRAITRDLEWGVPVPVPGYEDKRIYVWFEAVTGYLSASIEWAGRQGDPQVWERWWKDPHARAYYFIGKDNIPFHTVIWPAILMARGGLNLPYDVPANEYLLFGGEKASKSLGIGYTVPDMLAHFDPDPLRYYLSTNMPETGDTNFDLLDFIRRNNDELVATWGNLAHRSLTFVQRSFDGKVPACDALDPEVQARIEQAFATVTERLSAVHFRDALRETMALAHFGNRYFDERAPWRQVKEDKAAAATTMANVLNLVNGLKTLFAPFLPHSSERLHQLLGYQDELRAHGWRFEHLPAGQQLPPPTPLFRKLETPELS